jgi:hypothetical protein
MRLICEFYIFNHAYRIYHALALEMEMVRDSYIKQIARMNENEQNIVRARDNILRSGLVGFSPACQGAER